MSEKYKIVHDPVHGSIKVSDIALPLLNSLELSRLRAIKQLGLAHLEAVSRHRKGQTVPGPRQVS